MSGIPIITPLDATIGYNVKRLRQDNKISQEKLAELLECSSGFVSLLERGERAWSTKWIWKICQFFNVEAAELFGGIVISAEDRALIEAIKERTEIYKNIEASKNKS